MLSGRRLCPVLVDSCGLVLVETGDCHGRGDVDGGSTVLGAPDAYGPVAQGVEVGRYVRIAAIADEGPLWPFDRWSFGLEWAGDNED